VTIAALQNKIQKRWTEIMYGKQDCFKSILQNIAHRSTELHEQACLLVERSKAITLKQGRKTKEDMERDLLNCAMYCVIKLESEKVPIAPSSPMPYLLHSIAPTKVQRSESVLLTNVFSEFELPKKKDEVELCATNGDDQKLQSPDNADDHELQSADYEHLIDKALQPRIDCPALYSIDASHFWEAGLQDLEVSLSKLTISSKNLCNYFCSCNYVYTKQIKRTRKRIYLILSGHVTAT
jgi:hypothetical protein